MALSRRSIEDLAMQRAARKAANLAGLMARSHASNATMEGGTSGEPVEKREYIRSPILMKVYRLIACQHCGARDGTVCGAHSNLAEHGKGRSIKASDQFAASLCFTCHSMLDQGSILSKSERAAMWQVAHEKTIRELVRLDLWPKNIPVPPVSGMP